MGTTSNNRLCESAKLSASPWEDQFALYCCLHCLPPSNLRHAAGEPDPRIGVWTLVSAQSSLDPPNRLSITHVQGGGVHVVMSGETHFDFTANRNGHDSPAPGNLGFNQIDLHRIDKRQAEVIEKKDGTVVATVRNKLSKDGRN